MPTRAARSSAGGARLRRRGRASGSGQAAVPAAGSAETTVEQPAPAPSLAVAARRKNLPKSHELKAALAAGDIEALRTLGVSHGGFLTRSFRRRCWPLLLHAGARPPAKPSTSGPPQALPEPPEELVRQVSLDVNRSFVQFDDRSNASRTASLRALRPGLERILLAVFYAHPWLYYYQGFHDVCAVLQLVLGERLARAAAPNLALIWLRDFMEPNLSSSMKHVECIHPILLRGDPELYRFLAAAADAGGGGKGGAEAFHTWFAVSWVLTWLSHDVRTINEAMRLMDLFLCSGPLMPVYASAAIVISARAKLLGLDPDELDMAVIHSTVVKLPGLPGFDVEKVATLALDLYERIPPETLNLATRVGQDSCVLRYRQDYLAVEDPGEAFDADAIRAVFTKRCADKPKSFLPPWMRQKPSRRTIALVVLGGSVLLATVLLSTLQSGLLVDHFSL